VSQVRDAKGVVVATVQADADGTVVLAFADGCRLDAANTAPVVQAHLAAAAGEKRPTLADVRGMRSATRESRELAAGPNVAAITARMAIIVGNPVTRLLGNFFLVVTKPKYPTRLFTDEPAARAWLRTAE
jgi:hypothetical protein